MDETFTGASLIMLIIAPGLRKPGKSTFRWYRSKIFREKVRIVKQEGEVCNSVTMRNVTRKRFIIELLCVTLQDRVLL